MTERYSDNNELGSNPIDKGLDGVVKPDESNLPESGQDNISGGSKPVDEEIRILEDKIVDVSVVKNEDIISDGIKTSGVKRPVEVSLKEPWREKLSNFFRGSFKTAKGKIAAGLAAISIGTPAGVLAEGVSSSSASNEKSPKTTVEVKSEVPSKNAVENLGVVIPGEELDQNTVGDLETGVLEKGSSKTPVETTPSPPEEAEEPHPEVTPEYRASFKEQFLKPSIFVKNLEEQIANIRQDWIEKNYGPWMDKAKELGAVDKDIINLAGKTFYALQGEDHIFTGVPSVKELLTPTDVAIYAMMGEDKRVVDFGEYKSLFWLVVGKDMSEADFERVKRCTIGAIGELEDEGKSICETIKNGSSAVFYAVDLQPEDGYAAGLTSRWGAWNINLSSEKIRKISDEKLTKAIKRIMWVETFGVECEQLITALELDNSSNGPSVIPYGDRTFYGETMKYNYTGKEYAAIDGIVSKDLLVAAKDNIEKIGLSLDLVSKMDELAELIPKIIVDQDDDIIG